MFPYVFYKSLLLFLCTSNSMAERLESVRIGKCQNWKVSKLENVRNGKCQNWKVSELESVIIGNSILTLYNYDTFQF